MHWLVHSKFDNDPKVVNLISNLNRMSVGYTRATVVPYSTEGFIFETRAHVQEARDRGADGAVVANIASQFFVSSEEDLKGKRVFTYGSYTMAINSSKVFNPGAFLSPNISMTSLRDNYGEEMLNYDMVVGKIKDLEPSMDLFFIRPVEDTKSLVGTRCTRDYYVGWRNEIMNLKKETVNGYAALTPDTNICIASCKYIDAEFRCFVVDGSVVTASQYKRGMLPHMSPHVDDYVVDYVKSLISYWQPDVAFVLDVAQVGSKLKIIEANCINSSGLYDIDTQKLIAAIECL